MQSAEVDLIIDCAAGCIPIEIKMATVVSPSQLRSLTQYIENNNLPFGLLINQSEHKAWLTDKILQIPVGVI